MCISCVKERCPDRGRTCLEGGTYLLNYDMCAQCQKKTLLEEKDFHRGEDDDEETVSYKHVCQECGHVVATHNYTFSSDGDTQDYSMECNLCGYGEDSVAIIPDDQFA